MAEKRSALIVATSEYEDARLAPLGSPGRDAQSLEKALAAADIGGFDVQLALNASHDDLRTKLESFFSDRARDDLLLVHFSCHGLKDDDGQLYLAAADTRVDRLMSTGVEAGWVNRLMGKCRSEKIALFLDCCFGGAFTAGMTRRAGVDTAGAKETFSGTGRFVITASDAMQYSFEGGQRVDDGSPQPSPFTSALVEGLTTGEADRNDDGYVSINELFDYLEDRVHQLSPAQTPTKSAFNQVGDWVIAQSVRAPTIRILPASVQAQLKSEDALDRLTALIDLRDLIQGSDPRVSEAAMKALEKLTGDDSRRVAAAASRLFGEMPGGVPEPGVVKTMPLSSSPLPPELKNALLSAGATDLQAPAAAAAWAGPSAPAHAPAPASTPTPASPAAAMPATPPPAAAPAASAPAQVRAAAPAAATASTAAAPTPAGTTSPVAQPPKPWTPPPSAEAASGGALWGAATGTAPQPAAAKAVASPAPAPAPAPAWSTAQPLMSQPQARTASDVGHTSSPPWSAGRAASRAFLGVFIGLVLSEIYYLATDPFSDYSDFGRDLGAFLVFAAVVAGIVVAVEKVVRPLRIPGGSAYRILGNNRWIVPVVLGLPLGLLLAITTRDIVFLVLIAVGLVVGEAIVGRRGSTANAPA